MDGHNDECLVQDDAEVKGINHPAENAAEDQFATNSPQGKLGVFKFIVFFCRDVF